MARTELQKAEVFDHSVLLAASRLRLRALALINGAMTARGTQKAALAKLLGVRRTAVQHTLNGNGNLTLQTLAEYLGALGYEIELLPVEAGEVSASMRERRAPTIHPITLRDRDWQSSTLAFSEGRPQSPEVWSASPQSEIDAASSTMHAFNSPMRDRIVVNA